MPLDDSDFGRREWLPASGWPFDFSTLAPHYRHADRILALEPISYDKGRLARALAPPSPLGSCEAPFPLLAFQPYAQPRTDCGRDRALAPLTLQYAVRTNGRGPALFSSTRPGNAVANAAALADEASSPEVVERFAGLVAAYAGRVLAECPPIG
jgi:hypothetical protein